MRKYIPIFGILALLGMALANISVSPARANTVRELGDIYKTVAASATNQALGTGAKGDNLVRVIIIPATTSPGAVQIKDGSGAAITIFAGGTASVASLAPIPVMLNATSAIGAWQITTGVSVSVVAVGQFTP